MRGQADARVQVEAPYLSTVVEQPPTVPGAPTTAAARRGSLLRAELHRFLARRFLQVLLGVSVLGWVVATVIALTQFGFPTDADRAAAQAEVDRIVAEQQVYFDQCRANPEQFTGGEPIPAVL